MGSPTTCWPRSRITPPPPTPTRLQIRSLRHQPLLRTRPSVARSAIKNNLRAVKGQIFSDGAISHDGGAIYSDGAGNRLHLDNLCSSNGGLKHPLYMTQQSWGCQRHHLRGLERLGSEGSLLASVASSTVRSPTSMQGGGGTSCSRSTPKAQAPETMTWSC